MKGDKMNRLFISFSGGETSAFMTQWCLREWKDKYDEILVMFANTGQEREETLEFVEKCSKHFGFYCVWVEAVTHHGEKKGSTHKVVTFDTASRNGEPFEQAIRKYGIPNQAGPSCTRDTKLLPMKSYLREMGWKTGSYDTAIGIRADEIDRVNAKYKELKIVYPLVTDIPVRKPEINLYWKQQPFRLNLKGYEGNCSWCWKKSLRKHIQLAKERPEIFEFPKRMEKMYSKVGNEFNKDPDAKPRTFFRNNISTEQLLEMAKDADITPVQDDSVVYPEPTLFGFELDIAGGGCSEHCEVFHDNGEDSGADYSHDFFDDYEEE